MTIFSDLKLRLMAYYFVQEKEIKRIAFLANQNYSEVLPHSGQNGHHQKVYKK